MLAGCRGIFSGNSLGWLLIDFFGKSSLPVPLRSKKYIFKELSLPQLSFSTSLAMNFLWMWRAIVKLAGSLEEKLYYHACMTAHEQFIKCQPSGLTPNTNWQMVAELCLIFFRWLRWTLTFSLQCELVSLASFRVNIRFIEKNPYRTYLLKT